MTTLYSDERLPKVGELSDNLRNFDRDRLGLFDEKKVFDTIIREKQFPLFSNSYLLLLGPELPIEYVKYSNDRKEEFQIKTVQRALDGQQAAVADEREVSQQGEKRKITRVIEKHPLAQAAWQHIESTSDAYEKLKKRYRGSELSINRCELRRDEAGAPYLTLEYLEGQTLEELLDACLDKNDMEGFRNLFQTYLERISYGEEQEVTDYDLIFANILIKNNTWDLIDYEWTFDRSIDTKEIAFRAVYCYLLENEKRNKLNLDLITGDLGISQTDAEAFRRQEMKFQKYVTGKRLSMAEIREAIGHPVYTLESFCAGQEQKARRDKVQIYEDTGKGFHEEQSFFLEEDAGQVSMDPSGRLELSVEVAGGRSALRIDPCSDYCMIYIGKIFWNGEPISLKGKQIQLNGFKVGENTYVFPTKDPGITLSLSGMKSESKNLLQASMEVTALPEETAKHIQKRGLFG
jgi:hypothetical protein